MIKKLFAFLGLVLLAGMVFLAYLNRFTPIEIDFLQGVADYDLFTYSILLIFVSIFATCLVLQGIFADIEKKYKKQSRQNEKATIIKEEAQDKIMRLQAKIETLEKALQDAIKKD